MKTEGDSLGSLPEGWVWCELKELILDPKDDVVDGPFGSNLKASEYVDWGIPIIRLQNVKRNRFIEKNIRYITPEKAKQLARHSFSKSDIVITKLGSPLGKACLVPENMESGIIVADIVRVRTYDQFFSSKYLVYAINSDVIIKQLTRTRGTTRPRVNLGRVRKLKIPLAPLNEQRRIVSRVEELFSVLNAGVESLRKVKAQLKRYRQAVLKYAFEGKLTEEWRKTHKDQIEPEQKLLEQIKKERKGMVKEKRKKPPPIVISEFSELPEEWVWAPLGICCDIVSGYAFKSKDFIESDETPVIKISNIGYSEFRWQNQEYLPHKYLMNFPKYIVKPDTILMALTRPITNNTLKVCIYPKDAKTGLLNQRVAMINPLDYIVKKTLFLYLQSLDFKMQVTKGMSQTLQPNLSPFMLEDFLIPLSSPTEQKKIAEEIERRLSIVNELETLVGQSLKQAKGVHQSILKKAFEGKLVHQDPADEPAEKLLERIKMEKMAKECKNNKKMNKETPKQIELMRYVK